MTSLAVTSSGNAAVQTTGTARDPYKERRPPWSEEAEQAVLGAMLLGLGYGPVTPSSAIILVSTLPARFRSLGFSIKQTGVPVGAGACGLAIPALVAAFGEPAQPGYRDTDVTFERFRNPEYAKAARGYS